jgi:predicted nucleotidyltransferase
MSVISDNIRRLEIISEALGDLNADVIFIGGACVQFYVENTDVVIFRPTMDIDLTIKAYSYKDFSDYNTKLSALKFTHDTSRGAPLIRWKYRDITVDIIPDKASIVGYRDIQWFAEGRKTSKKYELPSGRSINILSLPYYIATKLEASDDRGRKDYLSDTDIEDIVTIFDGRDSYDDILNAGGNVKTYLQEKFDILLKDPAFKSSLPHIIGYDKTAAERANIVIHKIENIISQHNLRGQNVLQSP